MKQHFLSACLLLLLPACSWCPPSLHLADTLLHRDKTVIIYANERPKEQYEYKDRSWHPITLLFATDKGEGIIRRGKCAWKLSDNSARYHLHPGTSRLYYYAHNRSTPHAADQILTIPGNEFHTSAARLTKADKWGFEPLRDDWWVRPWAEFPAPVPGMPLPEPTNAPPAAWKRIAAVPLYGIDAIGTVALCTADLSCSLALAPLTTAWDFFTGAKEYNHAAFQKLMQYAEKRQTDREPYPCWRAYQLQQGNTVVLVFADAAGTLYYEAECYQLADTGEDYRKLSTIRYSSRTDFSEPRLRGNTFTVTSFKTGHSISFDIRQGGCFTE